MGWNTDTPNIYGDERIMKGVKSLIDQGKKDIETAEDAIGMGETLLKFVHDKFGEMPYPTFIYENNTDGSEIRVWSMPDREHAARTLELMQYGGAEWAVFIYEAWKSTSAIKEGMSPSESEDRETVFVLSAMHGEDTAFKVLNEDMEDAIEKAVEDDELDPDEAEDMMVGGRLAFGSATDEDIEEAMNR